MIDTPSEELKKLGLDAAQAAAGADAVEQVEVFPGEDSLDRPAYFFSFLIDQKRAAERPGLVRIRLTQALRDGLAARGDEHYPIIRILDRADWDRRARA
jgi:hypothetical protein